MKKILYSINTTGLGHQTRSLLLIKEFQIRGYHIDVATSGARKDHDIPGCVYFFDGLVFKYNKKGKINILKTLFTQNLPKLVRDIIFLSRKIENYDFVISDFEPVSSWSSLVKNKKCYLISNQSYFLSDNNKRNGFLGIILKIITKIITPWGKIVPLHFFVEDGCLFPPMDNYQTLQRNKKEEFYLVYLREFNVDRLLDNLGRLKDDKFVLYTNSICKNKYKNIVVKKITKKEYQKDLINCKGLITHGGFSSISECIYLKKKIGVFPLENQLEQLFNSKCLKKAGFWTGKKLEDIENFIKSEKINIHIDYLTPKEIVDRVLTDFSKK